MSKPKNKLMALRVTADDAENLDILRAYVRSQNPWSGKTAAIRAGLEIAARYIRSQATAR